MKIKIIMVALALTSIFAISAMDAEFIKALKWPSTEGMSYRDELRKMKEHAQRVYKIYSDNQSVFKEGKLSPTARVDTKLKMDIAKLFYDQTIERTEQLEKFIELDQKLEALQEKSGPPKD